MSDDPKRTAALILARMASCDGVIASVEREFLAELTGYPPFGDYMDTLIAEAVDFPLEVLLDRLTNYADRFFIAMRAYMMANVDADFDVTEERFFKRLVHWLAITDEDRELIQATHRGLRDNEEPHPRILELYEQSSFQTAESV